MTTIITVLMYSGRENPSWELNPAEAKTLKKLLQQKKEVTLESATLSKDLLGYTGFVIQSYDYTIPMETYCFDGLISPVNQAAPSLVDKDSELESFLFETGLTALNDEEKRYISDEISKNVIGGTASRNKSLRENFQLEIVPPFNPGKWNIPHVQENNNCYNYGNDKITNTFAQPGRGSGSTIANVLCGTVSQAAQRDGLIAVANVSNTPVEGHYVALVSANLPSFKDYHWYRLDDNAMWSHKPGRTAAKNTDNSAKLISDPKLADRGPYNDFCGYFHCIPVRTTIR